MSTIIHNGIKARQTSFQQFETGFTVIPTEAVTAGMLVGFHLQGAEDKTDVYSLKLRLAHAA